MKCVAECHKPQDTSHISPLHTIPNWHMCVVYINHLKLPINMFKIVKNNEIF